MCMWCDSAGLIGQWRQHAVSMIHHHNYHGYYITVFYHYVDMWGDSIIYRKINFEDMEISKQNPGGRMH